jgi:methionine synthase II (cobalamin-independent)
MSDAVPTFNFSATGVGSVPFQDVTATCQGILEQLPRIPYWPQFVQRGYLEDMLIQFSEGLPLLQVNTERRRLVLGNTDRRETELVTFYEHFLSEDVEHFAISRTYAPGLYELLERVEGGSAPRASHIKGQSVGPVTFASGIQDSDGKAILHSPELLDAMVNGLAIKALWQVQKMSRTGKSPILFLDEPALSGFGSAFSAIERSEVIRILRMVIDYLNEHTDALIGIHCCGNTDWSMIAEAGPHIINFDTFEYLDTFLLYREAIQSFFKQGGVVAWGIVPTCTLSEHASVEILTSRLEEALERLGQWNLDHSLLAERSILTPACGMGSMDPHSAERVLELLSQLSERFAHRS